MNKHRLMAWDSLRPEAPQHAVVANVDLVIIRWPDADEVSVLYGRCRHRGALMADGTAKGGQLACTLHGSTYRYATGRNIHYPGADLKRFTAWIEDGAVWVDADEIAAWEQQNPQKYRRDSYQGSYVDLKVSEEEPHAKAIRAVAKYGLDRVGRHGPMGSMGVPDHSLPH